jgi:hypothetical protein
VRSTSGPQPSAAQRWHRLPRSALGLSNPQPSILLWGTSFHPGKFACREPPADSKPAGYLPRAPHQAAQSGGRDAHLTLVNLTSKFRMGRGRADGFLSGCPFSTAPLVVAMAPPRSSIRGARVCGTPAQPGRCAACSRGDSSAPLYGAPHASRPRGPSNWLQDRRKGGRRAGGEEGAGPPHPTPPAAPAGARPPRVPSGCGLRGSCVRRIAEVAARCALAAAEVALGRAPLRAAGSRKSQGWDTGQDLSLGDRRTQLPPRNPRVCPRHLPPPSPAVALRTCPASAKASCCPPRMRAGSGALSSSGGPVRLPTSLILGSSGQAPLAEQTPASSILSEPDRRDPPWAWMARNFPVALGLTRGREGDVGGVGAEGESKAAGPSCCGASAASWDAVIFPPTLRTRV